MNTKFDLKSVAAGLVIGVLTVLAIGAQGSSNQIGRFRASGGADVVLIVDTTTGKAWCLKPNGVSVTGAPPGFFEPKVDQ